MKTAAQMERESIETAKNLPTETKRIFWKAFTEDGKSVGEARRIAGIDDVLVAAQLVIQCHKTVHVPISVDDIE